MDIQDTTRQMKLHSSQMAATTNEERNHCLEEIIFALKQNKEEILLANKADVAQAKEEGISEAVLKRLKFDESKLEGVISGIQDLTLLPDPLRKIDLKRQLDEGLTLIRQTCPIGVIGVIFEARPDALIQIATLCIKSGNCAILKGGRETARTNKILFDTIYKTCLKCNLPKHCLFQVEAREDIVALLSCQGSVDLLIPRGSNAFVRYIMDNTNIPVMGHSDGICHIYVDKDYDLDKAIRVIVDAKTQYTAACNATETLLVHKDCVSALMPPLAEALKKAGVTIVADRDIARLIHCEEASKKDYATEYLDLKISIKTVADIDEAIRHINLYGSHHTDAIITEDQEAAEHFMQLVDSAGVYQNCSTRFADGYRYGFGAEVGISTGKLHARGPVGLEGLCTYKYKLYGNGDIVGDYASGKKSFRFKDL